MCIYITLYDTLKITDLSPPLQQLGRSEKDGGKESEGEAGGEASAFGGMI